MTLIEMSPFSMFVAIGFQENYLTIIIAYFTDYQDQEDEFYSKEMMDFIERCKFLM